MAAEPNVLVRLRALKPSLVPSKRRVAEHILADADAVSKCTISELAQAAHTSETTIGRLCADLGLQGFRELRLELVQAMAQERQRADRPPGSLEIGRNTSLGSIVRSVAFNDQHAIGDTAAALDLSVLARAVHLVANARRIDIVGVGASAVVAADLHQKLHRIGLSAFVWNDRHAALTATALLRRGDALVVVSHSGATPDVLGALRTAKAVGARTIGLTGASKSPLAMEADLVLLTIDRETTLRSGATASRIAALMVVDVLFMAVAKRHYGRTVAALEATRRAVVEQ